MSDFTSLYKISKLGRREMLQKLLPKLSQSAVYGILQRRSELHYLSLRDKYRGTIDLFFKHADFGLFLALDLFLKDKPASGNRWTYTDTKKWHADRRHTNLRWVFADNDEAVLYMAAKAMEQRIPYIAIVDLATILPSFSRSRLLETGFNAAGFPGNSCTPEIVRGLYRQNPNWMRHEILEPSKGRESVDEKSSFIFNSPLIHSDLLQWRMAMTFPEGIANMYHDSLHTFTFRRYHGTFFSDLIGSLKTEIGDPTTTALLSDPDTQKRTINIIREALQRPYAGAGLRKLLHFILEKTDMYRQNDDPQQCISGLPSTSI